MILTLCRNKMSQTIEPLLIDFMEKKSGILEFCTKFSDILAAGLIFLCFSIFLISTNRVENPEISRDIAKVLSSISICIHMQ